MKITCFGSGIFSLAIALELAKQKKNHIIIWTPDEKWLKEVNKTNTFVINDEKYPQKDNITITTSYEEALKDTNAIFLLTASIYLKSVILEIKKYYKPNTPIFNASKGLIDIKPYYASRFIKNTLKTKKTAFLAGPNFAHDFKTSKMLSRGLFMWTEMTMEPEPWNDTGRNLSTGIKM